MTAQIHALPLPNPEDWITVDGAMAILGKSKRQVIRYMADQRLASYRIYGSHDRWAERLIWRADAEKFRDAMRTLGGRTETKRARRAYMADALGYDLALIPRQPTTGDDT